MRNLIFILFLVIGCKENTSEKKEQKPISIKKQANSIEKESLKIEQKLIDFKKEIGDLDNDGDLDIIYLYQCGEPKCIDIYINIDNKLEKKISENCLEYSLDIQNNRIELKYNHCCGESPFTSFRSYNLTKDKVDLNTNYVIFNESNEILYPKQLLEKNYKIEVLIDNYNVRFSPNIKNYTDEESDFSCEPNTNIIGKLQKGSILEVLSEIRVENKNWLFAEIQEFNLNNNLCNNPISFDFENQTLRAWISAKLVKKK